MDEGIQGPFILHHMTPPKAQGSKLMARFYEPLFMLRALGQTRGPHTCQPPSSDTIIRTRRRFLDNLCYICDYTKDGESCTAIGLEERPEKYQFWVSSNGQTSNIVRFLEKVLEFLYRISDSREVDLASLSHFILFCAGFAKSRIEKEQKCIQLQARECVSKIQNCITGSDGPSEIIVNNMGEIHRVDSRDLMLILGELINQKDPVRLCGFAHENRHATWMDDLMVLASGDEQDLNPEAKRSPFFLLRHYIGRLSHHIKAPRQLVEDSFLMQPVLQTHTIMTVAPVAAFHPRLRKKRTELRGIMNRMFREHDVEKEKIEAGLIYLDKITGVLDRFLSFYERSDSYVHAEIKVLEHFYWSKLVFAGNDRFIACSKPACFCCELYFKYHPGRIMISSSHRKVWTNWSPPRVNARGRNEIAFEQQKQIMSKITHEVRQEVINQVLQRTSHRPWHPDSRTGITESLATRAQGTPLEPRVPGAPDINLGSGSNFRSENERSSDIEDGGVPLLA